MKTISWSMMVLGAVGIGLYALANALVPVARGEFVTAMLDTSAVGAILHFAAGGVVIIVGALQFNQDLRSRNTQLHRTLGKVYVFGCILGGFAGLYMAFFSFGGVVTHWGFGTLAVCWIVATSMAYKHIRNGAVRLHQDWMIRSYALTLAALTLRIYLPVTQIAGLDFEPSYQAISWFCWVPNLIVAEWFIVPRSNRRPV
ncbi:MAG: DUF2306 domain-containing protein [Proteobacteria bacterium]|nr:DUF2306 domain-containing protein [Pseudomonadota bacterium]MDA0926649.1 DUF2306 domain-containing protein [Pseudomonadota bacterium]